MAHIKLAVLLVSFISSAVAISACDGKSPTQPSASSPAVAQDPSPTPRSIAVGQTISGAVTSEDPLCAYTIAGDGWSGLCDQFVVAPSITGVLTLTVTPRSTISPLAIFFKASDGAQIDMMCCGNVATLPVFVEAGSLYRVELTYIGRPAGYPQVAPVEYTLQSALSTTSEGKGSVDAIVFGDATRTQRLSAVRIEVLDGQHAGTVSRFDEETGLHMLEGLSPGYVNVRLSSDVFNSSTERLPVGASTPRELVLQRREPLPDTSGGLSGMAWDNATRNRAHVGVKMEIMDGPLTGAFTFTDDGMGIYTFSGLPPGPLRVRASKRGLQSQTLTITVVGNTALNFFMDRQ